MKDIQIIKKRLAAIQNNFNPQKNTYKVIEYVVNNDLTYNEMLMKLSEIKGFSKYPEDLKKEYISIINDIKKNIINQRKKEEREKQAANTKELKDIIDSLEKRKKEYIQQLDTVVDETKQKEAIIDERVSKNIVQLEENKETIDKNEEITKEATNEIEDEEEKLQRIKKVLIIGIIIVIFLIAAVLIFY